ncbi:hypothetical protein OYC64_003791 [Pagothenia borchgrevinki]|uniref:Uncharacterized protein n=1 Tax=Pagothenia borchgrevinki TaxID=8213 RepID=A0ABD2FQF6_PAGBO
MTSGEEAGRGCLIGVVFSGSLLRDHAGQTAEGGLNVQPGRSVVYRELKSTIYRSSQLTDEQPVGPGLGYTDWHSGSAVPNKTIGGETT